jgi:cardiolipin synthase
MPRRPPLSLRRRSSFREQFVEGNRVSLLRDGAEAFPPMLAAIEGAREQVLVEMYWFDSDQTGRRFADALKAARTRGCEVAVMYDALGSITADGAMFSDLHEHGVQVVDWNPVAPWRQRFAADKLTRRNHRKLVIVDGRIAFTGGFNFADHWLPPPDSQLSPWREDVVQVEGPVLGALLSDFHDLWSRGGGHPLRGAVATPATAVGNQRVQVLGQAHSRQRLEISRAYRRRIEAARERAWISNSYFVPDQGVVRALRRAAQRGVDVRILVSRISDIPMTRFASRARWETLLRAGVRIFEWQDRVMHSKSAVIDGYWSTLGSFNLDYISFNFNMELNVAIEDHAFGNTMEQSFQRDLQNSVEVHLDDFRHRPLGEQLLEAILYRMRKVL